MLCQSLFLPLYCYSNPCSECVRCRDHSCIQVCEPTYEAMCLYGEPTCDAMCFCSLSLSSVDVFILSLATFKVLSKWAVHNKKEICFKNYFKLSWRIITQRKAFPCSSYQAKGTSGAGGCEFKSQWCQILRI